MRRQLSVHLARTCNLYCEFCQAPPDGSAADRAGLRARLRRGRVDTVSLEGGGEPTVAPDLAEWLAFLRSCGVRHFHLSTNAVALADPRLARRLAREIEAFTVNLPACTEAGYRAATRSVKFAQAAAGLENLRRAGAGRRVKIFHVVYGRNYRDLPRFARWVLKNAPWAPFVNFTFARGKGRAAGGRLLPAYRSVAPFLKEALSLLKAGGLRAVVQNLPLCAMKGFEGWSFELQRWRQGLPVLAAEDPPKLEAAACARCGLEPACCGVRPDYARARGRAWARPSALRPGELAAEAF